MAHGNSLRGLVKYLDDMSDEAITKLNIPTGLPLVYELDDGLRAVRHYYLGDPEEAAKAAEAVCQPGQERVIPTRHGRKIVHQTTAGLV